MKMAEVVKSLMSKNENRTIERLTDGQIRVSMYNGNLYMNDDVFEIIYEIIEGRKFHRKLRY
jgi:hypothetical protein